jgi:hypothetical protein
VDPPPGATDISHELRQIAVTFDWEMQTENASSWVALPAHGLYPIVPGGEEPRFDETGRTCILPVRLQPGAVYAIGINSVQETGFRDADGVAAMVFSWAFATGDYDPAELPPMVIETDPPHGDERVDPGRAVITVTFDRPMRRNGWSWVQLPGRGAHPAAGADPWFDEEGVTCTLPVNLRPGTVYAIGVNSAADLGFKGRNGAPALPFGWAFKTREE